jgi:hypothetical protein
VLHLPSPSNVTPRPFVTLTSYDPSRVNLETAGRPPSSNVTCDHSSGSTRNIGHGGCKFERYSTRWSDFSRFFFVQRIVAS